jgi:RES domain-containing protein
MDVWRISNLSGVGGTLASGRWHNIGKPIVYLADHQAAALLEILVHMDRSLIPATYRLLRAAVPETVGIETISLATLSPGWQDRQDETRNIGDRWLGKASSAILRVPSAIVPGASNFLLNPRHAEAAEISIAEVIDAPFDKRLL